MVVTSFQYYSWPFQPWPYDLYIISPSQEKRKQVSACFSLAVEKDNNKISQYLQCLQKLIEGFSCYRDIEVKVWEQLAKDIHYSWMWKKEYENRKKRFEALCNAIKFIVQGLCEENKIKYKDIPHRVKEFDKFYDKIVGKINNEKSSEKLEKLEKLFRSPQLSFDRVIKEKFVKDIAGIRVNCYYKSDASRLWNLIKKNGKSYLLYSFDPKEPSTEPGVFEYSRFHLCVRLETKRLKLPEYSNLKDLPCEIQIGTILEEGWGEVDHEIIYKPESFLPDEEIKELKKISFSGLLPNIRQADTGFDKLRKKRKTKDFNHGGAS